MNASCEYPFDLRWTPQDLADAVPLRLSELSLFDANRLPDGTRESANAAHHNATRTRRPYLPEAGFASGFRIR